MKDTSCFGIVGGESLTPIPLQPNVVWLGRVDGHNYGILTSPPGPIAPDFDVTILTLHAIVGFVQVFLSMPEFVSFVGGSATIPDQILRDITQSGYSYESLRVDGSVVPCAAITYAGVRFVVGADPRVWPFAVARAASNVGHWPRLYSTGA
jgi:hypothetical protein